MLSYIFETVPISHGLSWYQTFNKWINPNFRGGTKILMALKMEVNLMTERWQTAGWKESTLGIAAISRTFKMTLAIWKFSAVIFSSVIHFVPPSCTRRATKMNGLSCFLHVTKSDDPRLYLAQPVCSLTNWNKWPLNRINLMPTAAALLLEHGSFPTERGLVRQSHGEQSEWDMCMVGGGPYGDLLHTHMHVRTHISTQEW